MTRDNCVLPAAASAKAGDGKGGCAMAVLASR